MRRRVPLVPWPKGKKRSLESRAKQGAALSARLASDPELKARIAPKGRVLSKETRQKIAQAHIGTKHTSEARSKMSIAKKGHSYQTTKQRAATSARFRGRPAQYPKKRFHYRGRAFRSSWELRAAQAMDALGVRWEYETKRFDLGTQTYAPDFYLLDDGAFWEVKGYYGPKSQRTIALFREQYPEIPLVLLTERGLDLLEQSAARKVA